MIGMTNQPELPLLVKPFHFPNFDVSWAGPGRNSQEFCFGSEDGQILFTNLEGDEAERQPAPHPESEAVNGVAFADWGMVISSELGKRL